VANGAGLGAALRGSDAVIDATNVATMQAAAAAEAFVGAAVRNDDGRGTGRHRACRRPVDGQAS